jgi:hypothetical protein
MKIVIKKVRRYIPDDELTADLKRVSEPLGKNTVSIREYALSGSFNSSTLIARFGSWNNALAAAGLKAVKLQKPGRYLLLKNLLNVWLKLGRQPRLSEMTRRISEFSRAPYIKYFGSWLTALEEFEKFIAGRKNGLNVFSPYKGSGSGIGVQYIEPGHDVPNTGLNVFSPYKKQNQNGNPRKPGVRLRMAVLKRDKFKCVLCGRTPARNPELQLELDHIIPWSKNGATVIDNLQTLCNECNNGKSDEQVES